MRLIFTNCYKYNPPEHDVVAMARKLQVTAFVSLLARNEIWPVFSFFQMPWFPVVYRPHCVVESSDLDPGSGAFLTHGSGSGMGKNPDP
jgi:hypothetical protein